MAALLEICAFLLIISATIKQILYKTALEHSLLDVPCSASLPFSELLFLIQSDTPQSVDEKAAHFVVVVVFIHLLLFAHSLDFLDHKTPPLEAVPAQPEAFALPEQLLFFFDFILAVKYIFDQPL